MKTLIPAFAILATSTALASPEEACNRVDSVYRTCARRYDVDERNFKFTYDRQTTQVACSDGKELPYFDRLDNMDISSVMMYPYVAGAVPLPETRQNWDPGRLRSEPLFKASFGSGEDSVRANLLPVTFLGQVIKFQRRLGAAAALKRVGEQLEAEAARDPSLANFLAPFLSKKTDLRYYGFFWRNVKGTTRLSSHSFGTAIDLLTDTPYQYWLWDEQKLHPDKAAKGENAYRDDHYLPPGAPRFHPKAVEIFERNGFVWGGKWNHYDTMHFEYRPEFFTGLSIDCALEMPGHEPLFTDAMGEVQDFGPVEADH